MWRLLSKRRDLPANCKRHQTLPVLQSVHRTSVRPGQMSVLWNRQVPDVLFRRNLLQVGMLGAVNPDTAEIWISKNVSMKTVRALPPIHFFSEAMGCKSMFLSACLGVLMIRTNPAASPVWTTAHTDSAQLTLALCCLSAGKILPRPQP